MQNVGAAWLMLSLNASPLLVALTQTASSLPFFIFALPAGAIGDIVDRRKLVLYCEIWMMCVAAMLTGLTFSHLVSPASLLILTFALSAGDAFESPTWRAILPELVQKEDLASASALNGIEFNIARAVGPGLAGAVIAVAGVTATFAIDALSFLGVISVVARWRRPEVKRRGPTETVYGATVAAIRYVHYSPVIRLLCLRSGIAMFFSSSLLALLPTVAHSVSRSPLSYGFLLGSFGLGAILGALSMKRLRAGLSSEAVVSLSVGLFGVSAVCAGNLHTVQTLALVMLAAGAAWVSFISILNVLVLGYAPDWVRARVLAVSLLVNQGAMAGGSALWGVLATRHGLHVALTLAGIGALATTVLGLILKLPNASLDLTPWSHWRLPIESVEVPIDSDAGPALVTVEYDVAPGMEKEFLNAIYRYERVRRRDGAFQWGVFRDVENSRRYMEIFLTSSWAEHLRQHERLIQADERAEARVRDFVLNAPKVTHFVKPTDP